MQLPKTSWLSNDRRLLEIICGLPNNSDDGRQQANPTYVGLTETSFKVRFANHKSSFSDPSKRLSTELSKHVWNLEEANQKFKISWKILKQTSPFSPVSNCCNLCLWEKYFIICRPELATLNRHNELVTSCRHTNKFLLKNFKPTNVKTQITTSQCLKSWTREIAKCIIDHQENLLWTPVWQNWDRTLGRD